MCENIYIEKKIELDKSSEMYFDDQIDVKIIDANDAIKFNDNKLMSRLVTHDNAFHCDEIASLVLLLWCPFIRDKNPYLIRTRDKSIINKPGGIVFDVGNNYRVDEELIDKFGLTNRTQFLDHHQSDFNEKWSKNHSNNMAAFGLTLKHYGQVAITYLLLNWIKLEKINVNVKSIDKTVKLIISKLYSNGFVKVIDSIDNFQFNSFICIKDQKKDLYIVKERLIDPTNLSSRVKRFYPRWNDKKKNWDLQFTKAFNIVKNELENEIFNILKDLNDYSLKKNYLKNFYEKRFDFHSSGEILYLKLFFNYTKILKEMECNNNIIDFIKFVIYPVENGLYMISTVSKNNSSENLISFPKNLSVGELGEKEYRILKRSDIKFIHKNQHIASSYSLEGAIKLCEFCLDL
jgi:uncharacterized UPF0160 family protein